MDFEQHCWAEVDLDALVHNFKLLQAHAAPAQVCAVVKAGAYGHGDGMVCRALEAAGAKWFAVSCLAEALHLRAAGIGGDILILGRTDPSCAASLVRCGLTQAVFSPEYARQLAACAGQAHRPVQVHLKVDTGMGRIGFVARGAADVAPCAAALSACFELKGLEVTGLFQHFAVADETDEADVAYTAEQHALFVQAFQALKAAGHEPALVHCDNSAGVMLHPEWPEGLERSRCMARPGIILYGFDPSSAVRFGLFRPVMKLKTVVSMVKELQPGQSTSYGRRFTAETPTKIATLCAGYADGYPRLLSCGQGIVEIHGKPCPVVGRVCMDQLMVDVTGIDGARSGDVVTLIGSEGGKSITLDDFAALNGTINYEEACLIGRRVPRVYIQAGREIAAVDYVIATL